MTISSSVTHKHTHAHTPMIHLYYIMCYANNRRSSGSGHDDNISASNHVIIKDVASNDDAINTTIAHDIPSCMCNSQLT
jgi:hypothetical protein